MTAPVEASAKAIAEAEAAAIAFQAALLAIGIKTIYEAIRLWRRVPANKAADVAADYLTDAVRLVMARREQSAALAVAYYRLSRALRTGATIPDPNDPMSKSVSLTELRHDFAALVFDASPADSFDVQGADIEIPIEEIDGIDEHGDSENAQLEADAEKEARIVLAALGPNSLKRRVEEIDHSQPATEVDALRDEAHSKAGSRQAAAAERIAMNGGRNKVFSLAERDKRVIGYVRASKTGTPCGWCAMLISRGFVGKNKGVLYDTEFAALHKTQSAPSVKAGEAEVGDEYHDNCKCYAEPVYSEVDLRSSRFDLNREYAKLWPVVTKGLSGKAAMTAWRRYFRNTKRTGDADPGNAQAA